MWHKHFSRTLQYDVWNIRGSLMLLYIRRRRVYKPILTSETIASAIEYSSAPTISSNCTTSGLDKGLMLS